MIKVHCAHIQCKRCKERLRVRKKKSDKEQEKERQGKNKNREAGAVRGLGRD